jgi:hypothetical protein
MAHISARELRQHYGGSKRRKASASKSVRPTRAEMLATLDREAEYQKLLKRLRG